MSRERARLHGQLAVLIAVDAELHAIGASEARVLRNREAIDRLRAAIADTDGAKNGDHADATASGQS
jgi:hypothetical protein